MRSTPTVEGRGWVRRGRSRVLIAAAVSAVTVAALSACSSSAGSSASSSAGSTQPGTARSGTQSAGVATAEAKMKEFLATPSQINITTPLKSPAPSGKKVIFVGTSEPSNVLAQNAVRQAVQAIDWSYSEISYDPANPATLQAAFQSALAKHPNYVVEAGVPTTLIPSSTIKQFQQAGVKLAITASYPSTLSSTIIAGTDGYANDAQMGQELAYYFVANSDGEGDALIEHVPAYSILDAFTSEFTSTVKSLCPSCKYQFVNVTLPQLAAGQTSSLVVSALRRAPGVNYLVFDDGDFADGITSALSAAGLSSVKVIGQAADTQGMAGLRAGTEAAWTGYSATYAGYETVDAMIRDAEGMPAAPNEGVQPTQLLTSATVGPASVWNLPTDSLSQFLKLWGRS
jgi:ribose transport system substrate-binding protein